MKKNGKEKNAMKKTVVVIAVLMMAMMLLTACGGGIKGTWYSIKDASSISYHNMEFRGGGEVYNEGVVGRYEVSGNAVNMDFFGVKVSYEIGKYEGYDVLLKNGRPVFCRSLEGAKKIRGY